MNQILLPVLIVAGIGIIAGVILAVASIVMAVPSNQQVEDILKVLPGANCGACGFSGCEGYAKALVDKTAKIGLCIPGGDKVSKEIADVLGEEAKSAAKQKAVVRCFGNYHNTEDKMVYQGSPSCAAAAQIYGGIGNCQYGCIGYGDCKNACEYEAIDICDGVAVISTEKCVGCGKCTKVCPKGLICLVPEKKQVAVRCFNKDKGADTRQVCKVGCIGCTRCVKECEHGAITVENSVAKIDPKKCTGCQKCMAVCKSGCLARLFGETEK